MFHPRPSPILKCAQLRAKGKAWEPRLCLACAAFLVSLGIAATSTQPAGHVHVVAGSVPASFLVSCSPDHGGMGSLFSTCCRQARAWMSTARWIHVAMWVSVPLYCHGGMGSPFGVHCRLLMADSPFERQPIYVCSVLSLCYSIVSCPL